jgi:hypothetical protein
MRLKEVNAIIAAVKWDGVLECLNIRYGIL